MIGRGGVVGRCQVLGFPIAGEGQSIKALWSSSAGKLLLATCAAARQLDRLSRWWEGAAKVCLVEWSEGCQREVLTINFQQSAYKRIFCVFGGTEAGLCSQPVGLKRDTFECKG